MEIKIISNLQMMIYAKPLAQCKAHGRCFTDGRMEALLVLGLPGIEAEENFEEDSHRPLINGAENEDDCEPNYSVQEDSTVSQVKAVSFHQACCLPGVIPVRTVQSLPQLGGILALELFCLGYSCFNFRDMFRGMLHSVPQLT
jgi:hypothetical protein